MNSLSWQQAPFDTPPLEGELLPFVAHIITLPYADDIALKSDVSYWKAQYARAIGREEALKKQLKHKEAIIRDLHQRLYGKHSEKSGSKTETNKDRARNNFLFLKYLWALRIVPSSKKLIQKNLHRIIWTQPYCKGFFQSFVKKV